MRTGYSSGRVRCLGWIIMLALFACATGVGSDGEEAASISSTSASGAVTASAGGATSSGGGGVGGAVGGASSSSTAAGGTTASSSEAATTTTASVSSSSSGGGGAPVVWVNEVHYDNSGSDSGEGIEIAGTAGLDVSNYALELHNGGGPALYDTVALTGTIPNQQNGLGVLWFALPVNGLQNGPADGIALLNKSANAVIQFLSYEGTLTATDGLANGQTSVDIGASESSGTPAGHSLQLAGMGQSYASFAWQPAALASPGQINPGQSFQ